MGAIFTHEFKKWLEQWEESPDYVSVSTAPRRTQQDPARTLRRAQEAVLRDRTKAKPETGDQAAAWQKVQTLAKRWGLCPSCASQLAWGHQGGFSTVQPPCADCASLIAVLPVEKPNGWRTVSGSAHSARSWQGHAETHGTAAGPSSGPPTAFSTAPLPTAKENRGGLSR